MEEIRKDVDNYEWMYQVSNLWRIKSVWRIVMNAGKWEVRQKEKILKTFITDYHRVKLCKNWKAKLFLIHRLIALAFLDNPENKECINHKDWDKSNNSLSNIERCTRSENEIHKYRVLWIVHNNNWLWKIGILNKNSRVVYQKALDWTIIKKRDCIRDVERILWYQNAAISRCCLKKKHYNTSHWFLWSFTP